MSSYARDNHNKTVREYIITGRGKHHRREVDETGNERLVRYSALIGESRILLTDEDAEKLSHLRLQPSSAPTPVEVVTSPEKKVVTLPENWRDFLKGEMIELAKQVVGGDFATKKEAEHALAEYKNGLNK